jgi:predicted transport protein
MKLFSLNKNVLRSLSTNNFKLEREIQTVVENNLELLFNLQFVKTELKIKDFRIDTLGYDKENKSFVIIEYKKERNFSIIDQGYTYMSLMLNNKSDFILEYNESCGETIKRDDIDWTQSKVIFVSPNFTEYQKHSINFKDVPFELWEIVRYENDLIGLVQHKNNSKESISSVTSGENNDIVNSVSKEIKIYDEEYHLTQSRVKEQTKDIYFNLKERVFNLGGDIVITPRKTYISYKRKTNFLDIHFLKEGLWCWINLKKGELDDPKSITRDVSSIGHYGNGDYELWINEESDLDYMMFLINQSYKKQDK